MYTDIVFFSRCETVQHIARCEGNSQVVWLWHQWAPGGLQGQDEKCRVCSVHGGKWNNYRDMCFCLKLDLIHWSLSLKGVWVIQSHMWNSYRDISFCLKLYLYNDMLEDLLLANFILIHCQINTLLLLNA